VEESELALLQNILSTTSANTQVLSKLESGQNAINNKVDKLEIDVQSLRIGISSTSKNADKALILLEVYEKNLEKIEKQNAHDKEMIYMNYRKEDEALKKDFDEFKKELPIVIKNAMKTTTLENRNWTMLRFIISIATFTGMAISLITVFKKG